MSDTLSITELASVRAKMREQKKTALEYMCADDWVLSSSPKHITAFIKHAVDQDGREIWVAWLFGEGISAEAAFVGQSKYEAVGWASWRISVLER